MIALKPISKDNFEDVLKLKASENFVAANSRSLASAYDDLVSAYSALKDSITTGEVPVTPFMPLAIMNDNIVVGFTMMHFDEDDGKDATIDGDYY